MKKNKKIHFEVSERKILLRFFDVFFVLVALYFVGHTFDLNYLVSSVASRSYIIVLSFYIICIGSVFEMYDLQVASNQFKIFRSIILSTSTIVLFYLLTPVFSSELPTNRFQIVTFYFTTLFALIIWRTIYVTFFASNRFVQNALLICSQNQLKDLIQDLEQADPHYKVVGYINYDTEKEDDDAQYKQVQRIWVADLTRFANENNLFEIVVATQNSDDIKANLYLQLLSLLEKGTAIREYTQVYEDKTQRIPVQFITRDFYKFFPFNRSNTNQLYLFQVRIMETIISIIGLALGVILIPFIALGNALNNPGKLFYTQERIGKNGKIFQILKFRTMIYDAEKQDSVFSSPKNNRITPFGKFLRKTRIDEFPQFVNILKGEMAVIGPRPERPFFVQEISEIMPFYATRHVIKPGLTGWAQVNYSYGESIEESIIKLQYDLYYIKHRSIFLDWNITIKTFSTILFYRGQ